MNRASRVPKHLKEVFAAVEKLIKAAGGEAELCATTHKGKHPKIIIRLNGHQRTTPVSKSPTSASECLQLKQNDVKRIIRELQALPPVASSF